MVIDVGAGGGEPAPKVKTIEISKPIYAEGLDAEIRAKLKKRLLGVSVYGEGRAAVMLDEAALRDEDLAFVESVILAHDATAAQAAIAAKDAEDEAKEVTNLLTAIGEVDGRTLRKVLRGLYKRIRKVEQDNDALRLEIDMLKAK